ncbi:hypothetical protein AGROH133_14171 (plasmid) [Agrobacterium tumefaciens]|nr:hypothetical protein AGROH133_14171 [Agrobacterium tumefaciens]
MKTLNVSPAAVSSIAAFVPRELFAAMTGVKITADLDIGFEG